MYLFILLTLRESSLDMTSELRQLVLCLYPDCVKNVQEVNERLCSSGYALKCIAPLFPIGTRNLHSSQCLIRTLPVAVVVAATVTGNCSKQEERQHWTGCTEYVAIWETGEWPEEWTFSTCIPLPKTVDLKQCENYRRIALVSHASKIWKDFPFGAAVAIIHIF